MGRATKVQGISADNYRHFKEMANNINHAEKRCIFRAKEIYGSDVFENFYIKDNFDFYQFCQTKVRTHANQTSPSIAVPFSDKTFEMFNKMKKTIVSKKPVKSFVNGKITDTYVLVGENDGKKVLFTLSIRKQSPNAYAHMNITLDLWIKGKNWIPIARIDTSGYPHPNYFNVDGSVPRNIEDIEKIKTPHLHVNSNKISIMQSQKLDYLPAEEIKIDTSMYYSSDIRIMQTYAKFLFEKYNIEDSNNVLLNSQAEEAGYYH